MVAKSHLADNNNTNTKPKDDCTHPTAVVAELSSIDLEDERLPLLSYEQNLMVDTFIDDVIFITAK